MTSVNAIVELKQPVSHIGDSMGIDSPLNRMEITMPDGSDENVPVITGNSVRGILRDHAALYMRDVLELADIPLDVFYLLFSGGSLTKGGGAGNIDLEAMRLYQNVPMVAVFGGAIKNLIIPGRLKIGHMLPIAIETRHLIPDSVVEEFGESNLASVYDMVTSQSYTRRDDAKNPQLSQYLEEGQAKKIEGAAAQQMRYTIELLQAGVKLYWLWKATGNALEMLAFVSALKHWGDYPAVGGKSGTGHGLCAVNMDNGWRVALNDIQLPNLDEYDAYLLENKALIEEALGTQNG